MKGSARDCAAFIADPHLSGDRKGIDAFFSFLDGVGARAELLVILGDLFELWLGSNNLMADYHREVLGEIAALKKRGVETIYTAGNRDFIFDEGLKEIFTSFYDCSHEFEYGGRRVHVVHGDLVNRRDYQYRIWRRVSRNPLVMKSFRFIPDSLSARLAGKIEIMMRRTNLPHKKRFPREECEDYARSCFRSSADYVILGHFHREYEWSPEAGKKLFSLPDWGSTGQTLLLNHDGKMLLTAAL